MNFHKGFVITQAANLISVRRAGIVKPRRQIHRALLAAYTAAEMFPSRHCRAVPALRGQAGTKGWPPMATAVMPASCAVSLRVNSSSSSRMKIGPRVRARTFRIRYLACSRPRAACGRHRILHPVSFTSGSPDNTRGRGDRSQPGNGPNLWGSSLGDSTAARYSRRAPTPARAGASRRWTGILPQRSIIQRRSFSLVRKLQAIWQARPTRPQLPVSDPYPRGSHFSPVMAYPFPVQPNEFPFRPGTGIGSQSVASTSRLRGRSA